MYNPSLLMSSQAWAAFTCFREIAKSDY